MKIWKQLQPIMSDSEKVMSYDNWLKYYYAMVKGDTLTTLQKSYSFLTKEINQYKREMSISELGYYNCDKPVRKVLANPLIKSVNMVVKASNALIKAGYAINDPKEYATINVTYTDNQNNKLSPKQVMMVDKRINSVAYLGNGSAMTVAVNSTKNLLAVMQNGCVGLFSEDDFKKINISDKNSYTFTLKVYQPKELDQLKKYLKY